MINRVNRAPVLKLVVAKSKHAENDPGSSQGSGQFYEKAQKEAPQEGVAAATQTTPEEEPKEEHEADSKQPSLKVIEGGEKPKLQNLSAVYEDFFKKPKEKPSAGLTTQYSTDGSHSKGILLNKKAE